MKVKDLRLHSTGDFWHQRIELYNQDGNEVFSVTWNKRLCSKPQAIAIAKRLCDRFNTGKGGNRYES